MAPVKAKKAVAAKKPAKKSVPKKLVKVKAKAKPSGVTARKNTAPKKKTSVKKAVKKAANKPAKKLVSKKSNKQTKQVNVKAEASSGAKKTSKKALTKLPEKKKLPTPQVKPIAKAGIKAEKQIKPVPGLKKEKTIKITPAADSTKKASAKTADNLKKAKAEQNALDPLQVKADKVMKELAETMDLSKMRPRISVGTSVPKPLPKHPAPPLKLPEPQHTTKEKFQVEFEFRSSPKILFTSLSDSSGLAGWFADEVQTKDDIYTFTWEGGESHARLVALRELQLVRFQWLDDTDGTYFQFEIKEDDITSDIALVITDFANPGEKDTSIRLWESQVQKLRMLLGSL